ncbi:hypothetical protein L1987_71216 [Smallanthus sonchifolius]|uniref:Uncharacterized protein n=1 Tax=Smallanthus sonchifolius TaxID=185202 RepID=A0ACB9ARG9_9ASTR|nr:hypothetical protein L1987_71216 [Smallanthus sonchifolius]
MGTAVMSVQLPVVGRGVGAERPQRVPDQLICVHQDSIQSLKKILLFWVVYVLWSLQQRYYRLFFSAIKGHQLESPETARNFHILFAVYFRRSWNTS